MNIARDIGFFKLATTGLGPRCVMIGTLTAGQFGIFDTVMAALGASKCKQDFSIIQKEPNTNNLFDSPLPRPRQALSAFRRWIILVALFLRSDYEENINSTLGNALVFVYCSACPTCHPQVPQWYLNPEAEQKKQSEPC
jgi:hypothetical protein